MQFFFQSSLVSTCRYYRQIDVFFTNHVTKKVFGLFLAYIQKIHEFELHVMHIYYIQFQPLLCLHVTG